MAETDNDPETSLLGSVLEGAYRIERLIAKNEMGAVYEAFHLRLDKPVAVRVLSPELAEVPQEQERFRREALVASGIGHPHIVQVFDHSLTPTGEPFLAMELLEGEDLAQRLARVGTLSSASTVQIVKQVASALAATHAKDIVHRNLVPANIWLLDLAGESNFVKLLGFGVSKGRSPHYKITVASMVLGTPNYLSPEQVLGKADEVDAASDQWALACIAWHCLSGAAPFDSDSASVLLQRIVQESPPTLAPRVPGLASTMEQVLLRALSKKKHERFADVMGFSDALERAFNGFPIAYLSAATVAPRAAPPATLVSVDLVRETAPATILDRRASPATARLPDDWAPRRAAPPTALLPESPALPRCSQPAAEPSSGSIAGAGSFGRRLQRRQWRWIVLATALAVLSLGGAFFVRSCSRASPVRSGVPAVLKPTPQKSAPSVAPSPPPAMPEEPVRPTLAEPAARPHATSPDPMPAKQKIEHRTPKPKSGSPEGRSPRPKAQPKLIFDL